MRHAIAGLLRRAEPADARLLDDFLAGRDPDAAFAALVARHGPVVRAACRRALGDTPDADDAFQATFVVLARRAADVWPREAVGAWLYGVAAKVARKARAMRDRRRAREQPLAVAPEPAAPPEPSGLCDALDRAVRALPEVYRAAVVACDLRGLSRAEAAAALGWKEGTLSGRLARARELLARRLTRAGFTLPAGGLAAVLGVPVPVGADLLARTAAHWRGRAGVPAPVTALSDGVTAGVLPVMPVAAAVLVLAAGVWAAARQDDPPPLAKTPPPAKAPAAPPVPLPSGRYELAGREAEVLAQEVAAKYAKGGPKTAADYRLFGDRIAARTDAIRSLVADSQQQLDEAELRAKEAAAGAKGDLLDARVAREFARRDYAGMRDYEPMHRHDLLFAETRMIRARERVMALEKPGAAAGAGVVVRGADGKDVFPVDRHRDRLDAFGADLLATCRTEVKDGAAERWAAALKGAHVRVRYAEPRRFPDVIDRPALTAEEFLIPATADRDPDVVLTRHGTTFRAFTGWRAEWAKDLRDALRAAP